MTTSGPASALDLVAEALAKHPELTIEQTEFGILVRSSDPGGFDVGLQQGNGEVTVFASDWHGHYDDPEEAASTFMWLLTPATRIILDRRGGVTTRWRMEWLEDGKWVAGDAGGLLVPVPFWWPKSEKILQNHLLPIPTDPR